MKKVIVLDTETTNSLDDPFTYDIGWAVVDVDTKKTIKTESYAVAEIFLDKELMASAYFVDKVPSYWEEIKSKDRKLARLFTIRQSLIADCKAYGDTLKMARATFKDDNAYNDFCVENGFLTQNGKNRYTAEILYRFLTGDKDFEEVHKGIDDVLIEKEILFACRDRGITEGALFE